MDKTIWLSLSKEDKASHLKQVLQKIVSIDKQEIAECKKTKVKPTDDKFKLEQRVLDIIAWEREDNED